MVGRTVSFCSVVSLAISLLGAPRAEAHSLPPRITQVLRQAGSPEVMVATTRGLLFGDPASGAWSLLCSEAFGVAVGSPYRVARLPSGRILLASLRGMQVSDDRGCSWSPHPALGQLDVTYLTQDPSHPERLYVTAFGEEEGGILASEDGGRSFRALYRAPQLEFLNSIAVAPSDARQLYATLSTTDETAQLFVLRSSDGGATWARTKLALEADMLDAAVLAVNPVDPRELLLRARHLSQSEGDTLLRTDDGGQTFTELGRYLGVSDAAFSTEGGAVFVATSGGMLRGSTPDRRLRNAGVTDRMTYVSVVERQVLVGGYYLVGDSLMVSLRSAAVTDPDASYARYMSFDQVTTPLACAATAPAGCACAVDWIDWSREFLASSAPPVRMCTAAPLRP